MGAGSHGSKLLLVGVEVTPVSCPPLSVVFE